MIKRRKKLSDVKYNHTSVTLFSPVCTNNMYKVGVCIDSRALSNVSKLIRVQETVCQHMKQKVIADDLFNKFAYYVKEYYKMEQFGGII